MNILVAPNAFKGSLTAREAGESIISGLDQSNLQCNCYLMPVADGGDGSLEIITGLTGAKTIIQKVRNPKGKTITSRYAIQADQNLAIVELAEASGLKLLSRQELDPWHSDTYGTGQLIASAINRGCQKILLAVGGSATVDGGIGLLRALGIGFVDSNNLLIDTRGPADLKKIIGIDISNTSSNVLGTEFTILADVKNRLLGNDGSVRIYGPQKGVKVDELEEFEEAMQHWSDLLTRYSGIRIEEIDYGGAAGGTPVGLKAFFNTHIINGAEYILELSGFHQKLEYADLVITCEGKIDNQTDFGKGPGLIARLVRKKKKEIVGFCGTTENIDLENTQFSKLIAINPPALDLEKAMAQTEVNLISASYNLGNKLAATNW